MVTLDKLPIDLLLLIFTALADIDFASLFTSRRACRAFQIIVTDILSRPFTNHGPALQTLFMSRFAAVFDSSKAGAEFQPCLGYVYGKGPFYSLPWASNPDTRAKYLREEASWRQIPLVSPSGHLVHRIQEVTQTSEIWNDIIDHLYGESIGFWKLVAEDCEELHYYFSEGLTLGMFYNQVVQSGDDLCGGWKLLWKTRVKDPENFFEFETSLVDGTADVIDESDVPSLFVQDSSYAILLFLGHIHGHTPHPSIDLSWQPTSIGICNITAERFPYHPPN